VPAAVFKQEILEARMTPTIRSLAACSALLLLAACGEDAPAPAPTAPSAGAPIPQPAPAAAAAAVQRAPEKAATAPQALPDPDADLAARVKKALEQAPGQIAQGIDVTARRGAVSLFGTAASIAERSTAGKIAASVSGVSSVDNKLVVVKGS
jgi:hypothetical protein